MVYLETGKMSWESAYGTGRYIRELIKANIYDYVICAASQRTNIPLDGTTEIISFEDEQYRKQLSDFIMNLKEGDIIHFPANTISVTNIPKYIKVVYTIHDFTPLIFYKGRKRNGNYFSDGTALTTKEWEKNVFYALKRADCVLTVSENTKDDILGFCNISEEKIKVIYHGIDKRFEQYSSEKLEQKRELYGLNDKKIIMGIVGGKHKNLVRMILAFYMLCLKNRKENYCLVLVGEVSSKINILTKILQIKRKAFLTGKVTDENLVWLYNLSECFVFVSLYEGFGFPLLEAYACGIRVVVSNSSSLKELSRGYAQQVNPKKICQISYAMKGNGHQSVKMIREQISYADSFTWKKSREQHKNIIENLAKD